MARTVRIQHFSSESGAPWSDGPFPHYEIVEKLGEGGMVYKAHDTRLDRFDFAIVSSGLYFVPTRNSTGDSSIQFPSFATNKIRNITTFNKLWVYGLAVSPDGKWILYGLQPLPESE